MEFRQASHERLTTREEVPIGSNRAFGFVFAIVFAAVGLWPLIAGAQPRPWALVLAAVFLLAALFRPALLERLNRLWFRFGALLHRAINPAILGLLYYLTITPIAVVLRLSGKDPLQLVLDAKADSYWIKRQPPGPSGDSMRRQF